jgi:four helix bundle protein
MTGPLQDKSYAFALRVAQLSDELQKERKEFVISRKLLDSGINVGLFIEEGRQGDDRIDLRQKYSLANKEAFKSHFLLRLLRDTQHLNVETATALLIDCEELQKMLIAAIKTLRTSEPKT